MKTEKNSQDLVSIPKDITAEKMLLGNLILKPELIGSYVGLVEPEEFYYTAHRLIFRAMIEIFQEKKEFDVLALSDKLDQKEELTSVGGISYLSSLVDPELFIYRPDNCAKKIKETALRRKTLRANELVLNMVSDPTTDWMDVVQEVSRVGEIVTQKPTQAPLPKLNDLLYKRLKHVEELSRHPGQLIGVSTGFPALDRITCGLQPGNLIVIAARPSKGKTSLALNIAEHACSLGKSVAFFSLEMTDEDIADRFLCSVARVDLHLYRTGYLNREEWERLGHAHNHTFDYKLTIDQTTKQTPLSIRLQAIRIKKEMGLDMIVVDYLQLINSDTPKEKRYQEIGQVTHELKAIAKELGIPVVALAQLSRKLEERADKRPQLSDLREAGDIEQEADVVCLLHTLPADDPNVEDVYPRVNLLVEKHRNGPLGEVELVFQKEFTRFESAA